MNEKIKKGYLKKKKKKPYPFLFIGGKPVNWTEGSNCGYKYTIRFSREPDSTEKNMLESNFLTKLSDSKAVDPDCQPLVWDRIVIVHPYFLATGIQNGKKKKVIRVKQMEKMKC